MVDAAKHGHGKLAYEPPTAVRLGTLIELTQTRVGEGDDLLDARRLATEPKKPGAS